jgi:hypothetical protein
VWQLVFYGFAHSKTLFSPIGGIREISGLSTSTLQRINDLTLRSHFPRKGSKNFTQYSSERPEMTTQ